MTSSLPGRRSQVGAWVVRQGGLPASLCCGGWVNGCDPPELPIACLPIRPPTCLPRPTFAGTTTTLTRKQPLNPGNLVAMELTSAGTAGRDGIVNSGYWGIAVEAGVGYIVSLYLRTPNSLPTNATVALLPGEGSGGGTGAVLAAASLAGLAPQWQRFTAELVSASTDYRARLAVRTPAARPSCRVAHSMRQ